MKKSKIDLLKEYYIYFMFYAIFGWCYEVFLEVFIYKWGFSNRGFLFGPYCPVYGFGALAFIICLRKLKEKKIKIWKINITPVLVFLGIVVISTLMELGASYLMEIFTGKWMWDYTRFSFNFQGRIALNPSIRFGIGGMIFMYLFQPLFEKGVHKLSKKGLTILSCGIGIVFVTDFVIKICKMFI